MIIEFSGIETSYVKTDKGGYSKAVVSFTNNENGRPGKKTLTSFANPKVFDTLKEAKSGQVFDVTEKQNGDFTNWASLSIVGDSTSTAVSGVGSSTSPIKPPVVSQYETRDERNARQRLIVRQSSLSNAVAILATGAKSPPDPSAIKSLADDLTAFVYESETTPLMEMTDDIPY